MNPLIVYKLGVLLGSVDRVTELRSTKLTPVTAKEWGDLEINDYIVLQNPQEHPNRLPPPRAPIMDFTMTHIRFGRSNLPYWTLLDNLLTENVQMVLLRLMVF